LASLFLLSLPIPLPLLAFSLLLLPLLLAEILHNLNSNIESKLVVLIDLRERENEEKRHVDERLGGEKF